MYKISIESVNSLEFEEFIEIFGEVVEHGSLIAAMVWSQKPFRNANTLHKSFCSVITGLPKIGKEGLLRCHPDLAGRFAECGKLTSRSEEEHEISGLNTLTQEERENLRAFNENYKNKFQFPFVICARENKKAAIKTGIANRCLNTPEVELENGVQEIQKIAFHRILQIV